MRHIPKIYSTTKQAQILTALVLSSILSVGGAIAVPEGVTASPAKISAAKPNKSLKQNSKNNGLPTSVASQLNEMLPVKIAFLLKI